MVRAGEGEHNVRFTIVSSSFDQLSMGPSEVELQSCPRTRSAISPVPIIRLGCGGGDPFCDAEFEDWPGSMLYRISLSKGAGKG
jgi:hypothetical protein